jgi:molecular chaperone Hsp33
MLYNEANAITGTVELRSGNIAEDIAFYLFQSEQIPSAITLDVGLDENGAVTHAGGILIQALPGAPDKQIETLEANLQELIPLADHFANDAYIDDLMSRVLKPLDSKELNRVPVHFFCRCTKDRFVDALALLNLDELEQMKEENQELVCHYCSKKYVISSSEIHGIVEDMRVKMN